MEPERRDPPDSVLQLQPSRVRSVHLLDVYVDTFVAVIVFSARHCALLICQPVVRRGAVAGTGRIHGGGDEIENNNRTRKSARPPQAPTSNEQGCSYTHRNVLSGCGAPVVTLTHSLSTI